MEKDRVTRVCIVSRSLPPEYGGAEIAAYRYGERLAASGHPPLFIAPDGGEEYPDWVVPLQIPSVIKGVGARTRLLRLVRSLWPVMWKRRHDFDVVHIFNSAPLINLLAVPMARALGKPVVLESSLVGSDDPLALMKRKKGRRRRLFLANPLRYELYRRGSAFISKSPVLLRACKEAPLPQEKMTLIPYAVDCDTYRPSNPSERRDLRRALELPEGPTVLFVGGMNKRKGVHHLLEAFRSVVDAVPEARLALVGPAYKYDPEFVEGLYSSTEAWGLSGHVTFVNRVVDNVHEYLRASDVFTLPSSREGLPIAVLESMAAGKAVVASDIPEIADSQIEDGTNGLLVPFGDVEGLAKALTTVLAEPGRAEALGAEARRRALDRFSVPVVDAQYRRLYEALLSGGSPAEAVKYPPVDEGGADEPEPGLAASRSATLEAQPC